MTDLTRIADALERIAAALEAKPEDPPEPDWKMPTEAPRVYRLSGDGDHHVYPAGVGR